MVNDFIQTSSRKRQIAWNTFSKNLERWCLVVDGFPVRKREIFDMLYKENDRNQIINIIQDRLTDTFSVEKQISGNAFTVVPHSIEFKPRPEVIGYNAQKVEESNVKLVIHDVVRKELKHISGGIDMNRLGEILNSLAYLIYQKHDYISKEADKLYRPI